MKSASLVCVLMCVPVAHTLICFTCEDQSSNWNCLRPIHCPGHENRCLTIGTVSGTGNDTKLLITKKCGERCPSEQEPAGRASSSLFCCGNSLCNIGPPK